jgi:uncharacterized OsmC-like protein
MTTRAAIREAVAAAGAYLTEHPAEARYRDGHARARVIEGLLVEVVGPTGEQLRTDMPRAIGGTASSPSPGWYMRAAAAACVASLIMIRAAAESIDLPAGGFEVTVDSESDDRGILGLDAATPAGPLSVRIAVAAGAPGLERATVEALVRWAIDHCPVTDGIRRAVELEIVIT